MLWRLRFTAFEAFNAENLDHAKIWAPGWQENSEFRSEV